MLAIYIFKTLFIFRERGREEEREEEKYQCVVASHVAPTGDLARNPGRGPDWESNQQVSGLQPMLNPLSYTSQGYLVKFSIVRARREHGIYLVLLLQGRMLVERCRGAWSQLHTAYGLHSPEGCAISIKLLKPPAPKNHHGLYE